MAEEIEVKSGIAGMIRFAFGYGMFTILPNTDHPNRDQIQVTCADDSAIIWNGEPITPTPDGFAELMSRMWRCQEQVSFSAKIPIHSYRTCSDVEFTTKPFSTAG